MRLLGCILALALAVAAAPSADFWPMPVGAAWAFRQTLDGKTSALVMTVLPDGGLQWAQDGKPMFVQKYERDSGDLELVSGSAGAVIPPRLVLKTPLIFESQWSWQGTEGGRPASESHHVVAVGVEVRVPAGAFTATRIDTRRVFQGQEVSKTAYFAPGVGPVKISSGSLLLELASYRL